MAKKSEEVLARDAEVRLGSPPTLDDMVAAMLRGWSCDAQQVVIDGVLVVVTKVAQNIDMRPSGLYGLPERRITLELTVIGKGFE